MNRTSRTAAVLLVLFVIHNTHAAAADIAIPVIGHDWYLTMDIPELEILQGRKQGPSYQFQGVAPNGFNVSFFVEPPATREGTHDDCYSHYWEKMKQNPLIDSDTVKVDKTDRFVKVAYEYKGLPEKAPKHHFNYYIVHGKHWIDIHLSMVTALKPESVSTTFEKSIRFRAFSEVDETEVEAKSPQ